MGRLLPTLLLSLLVILGLIGCHSPSVVGHWKGQPPASATGADNPMAGLATGMANSVTIDFKSDNTFDMTMLVPISGTWTQSGNSVTLTPKTAATIGTGNNQPVVLTLSSDGSTLTPQDSNSPEGQFTFKRA